MTAPRSSPHHAPRWPRLLRAAPLFHLLDRARTPFRERAIRRRMRRWPRPASARRVLLLRDRGLGDILQATALFEPVRERYGAGRLELATSAAGWALLADETRLDDIRLAEEMDPGDAEAYDLVLNLQLADNSPALAAIARAVPSGRLRGRGGTDGAAETWLEAPSAAPWLARVAAVADVPYARGMPLAIRLPRSGATRAAAAAFRARAFAGAERPAGLCIGGADWRRNPSPEWLGACLDALEAEGPVVLLGRRADRAPGDRAALDALAGRPGVIDLLDCTLADLLGAVEGLSVLVTPDTGPLHMALALGTPVVGLFGSYAPERVLGIRRSPRHEAILPRGGCRLCAYRYRDACLQSGRARCLEAIDPARAVRAARRLARVPASP
jgi:ADP-heptose:LPS heptosyltransferase